MLPLRLLSYALVLTALVACGDSTPQDAGGTGSTRVVLSDAPFPFDRVARVDLYIVSVSGSLSPDTSAAGTFVTLASPHRSINLLALQNGVIDELGRSTCLRGSSPRSAWSSTPTPRASRSRTGACSPARPRPASPGSPAPAGPPSTR